MFKFLHLHPQDEWLVPFSIASCVMVGFSVHYIGSNIAVLLLLLGLVGHAVSTLEIYNNYTPRKSALHLLNCVAGTLVIYVFIIALKS